VVTDDASINTNRLYEGTIKLIIRAPVELSQIYMLEECLSKSPDLRVESVGGSPNEGNIITISINKQKPIFLLDVLRAMPPVKQVVINNNQIVVILQPPASS
jgi:hypothetical protein